MLWCRMCEREVQRGSVCEAYHYVHQRPVATPPTLNGGPRGSMGEPLDEPHVCGLAAIFAGLHNPTPALLAVLQDEADRAEIERINLRRA